MANETNYLLRTLIWMKTKDATKKPPQNRPKMFTPDFMEQPDNGEAIKDTEAHTTADIDAILAKKRV